MCVRARALARACVCVHEQEHIYLFSLIFVNLSLYVSFYTIILLFKGSGHLAKPRGPPVQNHCPRIPSLSKERESIQSKLFNNKIIYTTDLQPPTGYKSDTDFHNKPLGNEAKKRFTFYFWHKIQYYSIISKFCDHC